MPTQDLWRAFESAAPSAAAWLATYLLHSTLLLLAAWWLASRLHHSSLREWTWKLALVGGVLTASVQSWVGSGLPVAPTRGGELLTATEGTPRGLSEMVEGGRPLAALDEGEQAAAPAPFGAAIGLEPTAPFAFDPGQLAAPVLVGPWVLGALFLAGRRARRASRWHRRLRHRRRLVEGPLRELLDRLVEEAGYPHHVQLSAHPALASPVALSPREITIPVRMSMELTPAQQEAALAHELAHVLRRDPSWMRALCLFEIALFMQPLQRIALRAIRAEAEFQCDDWAAQRTGRPLELARCLSQVASWSGLQTSTVTAMVQQDSPLVQRVGRLVEGSRRPGASRRQRVALTSVGALALGALAWAGPSWRAASVQDTRESSTGSSIDEETRRQLEALGYVAEEPPALEADVLVEISADGSVLVDGREVLSAGDDDLLPLRERLALAAKSMPRVDEPNTARPLSLPDGLLAIRGALDAPARRTQQVMQECGRQEVQIWRIRLELFGSDSRLRVVDVPLPKDVGVHAGIREWPRLELRADVVGPLVERTHDDPPPGQPVEELEEEIEEEEPADTGAEDHAQRHVQYQISSKGPFRATDGSPAMPPLFLSGDWSLESPPQGDVLRDGSPRRHGRAWRTTRQAEVVSRALKALQPWIPEAKVTIDARRGLRFGELFELADGAKRAGFEQVVFVGSYS